MLARIIKIKMFPRVVRTLGGVTYVLKMRNNLISLSLLHFVSCRHSAIGEAMKITCGCLVLMKGEKYNVFVSFDREYNN